MGLLKHRLAPVRDNDFFSRLLDLPKKCEGSMVKSRLGDHARNKFPYGPLKLTRPMLAHQRGAKACLGRE